MICIPIVGPTMEQALKDIEKSRELADMIELRLDLIDNHDLKLLMKQADKPAIVTNRSKMDGGQFRGSEEERVAIIRQAIDSGAKYIDIETSTPGPLLKSVLENKGDAETILSHHDFTRTGDKVEPLYELMSEMPADILKIITYAMDITDNVTLFNILYRAKKDERRLIAFCMGELGEVSRILTVHLGGWLTFGSLDKGKESAPGQITADVLKHVYRVNDIDPKAKVFGVIGDPVNKSMGYRIHNRAFQETKLPHVYVPFLVSNVLKFFNAFEPYLGGLSVTMPHKEDIKRVLDEVSPEAEAIGAINTVVQKDKKWVGKNTDGAGALKALTDQGPVEGKNVLIIGAGGTARAIGHVLKEHGAKLTLTYNRNKKNGEALAEKLSAKLISIVDVDKADCDILINCSPVGMTPNTEATPFPARLLKPGMTVFDSVYNPMETRLLKDAKAAGCTAISGVELFVNQAVLQFELWTGQTAPYEAMRNVVLEQLA